MYKRQISPCSSEASPVRSPDIYSGVWQSNNLSAAFAICQPKLILVSLIIVRYFTAGIISTLTSTEVIEKTVLIWFFLKTKISVLVRSSDSSCIYIQAFTLRITRCRFSWACSRVRSPRIAAISWAYPTKSVPPGISDVSRLSHDRFQISDGRIHFDSLQLYLLSTATPRTPGCGSSVKVYHPKKVFWHMRLVLLSFH